MVDAHSKWLVIFPIQNADTRSTIAILKRLFSQYDLPETLVSDHISQFTSETLYFFYSSCHITHIRSPLYHSQSNGQSKRFVDTFKRALPKAKGWETTTEEILNTFLFSWRTTTNASIKDGISPIEQLMGQKPLTTKEALLPQKQKER